MRDFPRHEVDVSLPSQTSRVSVFQLRASLQACSFPENDILNRPNGRTPPEVSDSQSVLDSNIAMLSARATVGSSTRRAPTASERPGSFSFSRRTSVAGSISGASASDQRSDSTRTLERNIQTLSQTHGYRGSSRATSSIAGSSVRADVAGERSDSTRTLERNIEMLRQIHGRRDSSSTASSIARPSTTRNGVVREWLGTVAEGEPTSFSGTWKGFRSHLCV